MVDVVELIKSRRTVKQFLPKFVDWDKISKVVDAGRHAPSSGNIQNWKFIVILEPEIKQKVAQASFEQYDISIAGALIVVVSEPEKVERYYGLRGERLYSIQNCAAAIENMLIAAQSLGLSTCWVGGFNEDELKSALSIPEEVRPQAIIALGYAKETPGKPPKYPLESLVYFNRWRNRIRDPAVYSRDIATILARKRDAAKDLLNKGAQFVVDKSKESLSKISKEKEE